MLLPAAGAHSADLIEDAERGVDVVVALVERLVTRHAAVAAARLPALQAERQLHQTQAQLQLITSHKRANYKLDQTNSFC